MKRSLLLLLFAQEVLLIQSLLLEEVLNVAWCLTRCNGAENCLEKCKEARDNVTNIPYIDGPSESNVSIHCKDANRLVLRHNPGMYVIETESKGEDAWTLPTIRKDDLWIFEDLLAGKEYRYRVHKVTSDGVALSDVTEWFKTEEESFVPKEVKELYISDMDLTENKMETYLNIVPADDLNCLYDIIHWGDEHKLYQYQLDASQELYRIKLRHLEYNKPNTIYVISRNENGLKQSNNVSLTFQTPSCLSLLADLRICAPAPVTGLQVSSTKFSKRGMNFNVSWDEPELEPNNFTVIIQPLDCKNGSVEVTFPGNQTSVEIQGVAFSRQYKVAVIAESEGGSSLEWQLFKGIEGDSFGSEVLVAGSALTTIAIFATIAFVYYRYKHSRVQSSHYNFFKDINRKNAAFEDVMKPLKLSYEQAKESSKLKDKFEIDSSRLQIKRILGSGISGVVKLATFQDNEKRTIDVAVKMLREDASSEDVKNFHREILLMKSAGNHPNIVSLIGCCSFSRNPLLVVEYCSKGDLLRYLRRILEEAMEEIVKQAEYLNNPELGCSLHYSQNERDTFRSTINNRLYEVQAENLMESKITAKDLLGFAKQVATGLEFLSLNRIVHRDLAARNVLVCADNTVKISDFGLSRDIYQENVYKKEGDGKLPIKWMALEALTHQVYTSQSDVWSFGILLYEIVTLGGNPYPGMQSSEILHLLKSGYRMERPSNCGFHLYEIMRSCWHENPSSRPSFSHLRHQLNNLLTSITSNQYLNLTELLKHTP